ncbi:MULTISPECIES: hydrogen peroxide-inducible genes activator [Pseudovibrio]|uniref:hydrogen peroxide-inducible genes activator n=1 Tax=Stappiaceae TaxID=2821832 RepID=UPI002366014A|nr:MULTISPECIES: hydrogen peroxide-inducible genes activator [Pseudovibrio]MDD7910287.1 hydrogen peroxide-inducible genes activator [Pseudovibrio exalbescens]MDX5594002.1 hydrogen peroxide-inducible genes activator [Pseudovibrio sp. SPO723]
MITLKQLRYFWHLSQTQHFGQAAEAAAISQPALSMQIRDMETTLGLTLVERSSKTCALTPEGKVVARRAAEILSQIKDLEDYAQQAQNAYGGAIHLGIIPSLAPYMLPSILPAIADELPDLELRLRETMTDTLVEELKNSELDAVILALPIDDPELEQRPLFIDRFLLATQNAPDLDERRRIKPIALDFDRMLLLEEGHCLRAQTLDFCGNWSPKFGDGLGATSLATIMQMVANGYGVTILPEICIPAEVNDERVALLRFEEPQPSRQVGLIWRKSSPRAALFEQLQRIIRSKYDEKILDEN